MRIFYRWKYPTLVGLMAIALTGCTDLLGPEDARYEEECVVYVAGDATMAEIKMEIRRQLTDNQRARCRPPHVRMVTFG